jgi:hypothetical protein
MEYRSFYQIFREAGCLADWEVGDTAGLETAGTRGTRRMLLRGKT